MSQGAHAFYLSVMGGPKFENLTEIQAKKTRSNPLSILTEAGFRVKKDIYLAVAFSGEFNISTMSTTGFTLMAFGKYYIKGSPDLVRSSGKDIKLTLSSPYTLFTGLGLFQKNVEFEQVNGVDIEHDLGGVSFVFGGSYDLSERYYVNGQALYTLSGMGTKVEYNSMEAYVGIGVRF